MTDWLTVGTAVEVIRAGERTAGYIVAGPLPHLLHIGTFYLIGAKPPRRRGASPAFGMYAQADILIKH